MDRVKLTLGDTRLPRAPVHGGSLTMASVGSAVQAACQKAREQALSKGDANDPTDAMRRLDQPIEASADVTPGDASQRFSMHAFGAVFVEVAVDPDLGETRSWPNYSTARAALLIKVVRLAAAQSRAKPRVVVTGGAGFLGSNIVDALAARGERMLVLDSLTRPRVDENLAWLRQRHPARLEVCYATSAIRRGCARLSAAPRPSHLAAQVAVTTSVADPLEDFEVNARGTLNVLEAVRAVAPEAPVLFASTNKVYGKLVPVEAMVRRGNAMRQPTPGWREASTRRRRSPSTAPTAAPRGSPTSTTSTTRGSTACAAPSSA